MRAFERAIRRARLPIRVTSGFNPHPKISFPLSLAVGIEGREEVAEFDLTGWVPLEELEANLRPQLPEGIEVASVEVAPPGRKGRVVAVAYEVRAAAGAPAEESPGAKLTQEKAEAFLRRDTICVRRPAKGERRRAAGGRGGHGRGRRAPAGEVDLRPYIQEVAVVDDALRLHLKVTPQGTARVEEVLLELGLLQDAGPCPYRIVRTRVVLGP